MEANGYTGALGVTDKKNFVWGNERLREERQERDMR
jgi:hypothetical protein